MQNPRRIPRQNVSDSFQGNSVYVKLATAEQAMLMCVELVEDRLSLLARNMSVDLPVWKL
jgi:hypothetical protein